MDWMTLPTCRFPRRRRGRELRCESAQKGKRALLHASIADAIFFDRTESRSLINVLLQRYSTKLSIAKVLVKNRKTCRASWVQVRRGLIRKLWMWSYRAKCVPRFTF